MKNFFNEYCDAIDAGLTLEEFANKMGVSKSKIFNMKYKMKKSGVKIPDYPRRRDWRRIEELMLIDQYEKYGGDIRSVSIPGKTFFAIRNKAARIGLTGSDGVDRTPWTEEEIAYLKRSISNQVSRKTICKKLGKSSSAVSKKAARMNLIEKRKSFKKLSGRQLDLFHDVIRKLNLTLTPKQIAEYWNKNSDHKVTDKTVRRHRAILGINTNRLFTIDLKNEQAKKRREKEETEAAKNSAQTLI